MDGPQIYLASGSPRRRELLAQLGVRFAVVAQDVPERRQPGETPRDFVARLALAKARAGWSHLAAGGRRPVLGADTTVVVDDEVLGKPANRVAALAMLARLSGRSHQVLSAVAVVGDSGREGGQYRERLAVSESRVRFRPISEAEREAYWASGEPRDKAGGYAIQGRGAVFVAWLEGSYSGVVGLPLFETGELLQAFGIQCLPERPTGPLRHL